jgi:cell wall-associated NlpC family hydrolase
MVERNQLFFIIFTSVLVGGCGALPIGRGPGVPTPRAPIENRAAMVPAAPEVAAVPAHSEAAGTLARDTDMLFHALAAAGADYRRGGKSYQSGFDCSGLVSFVYREAYGLALPHNTQAQSQMGEAISTSDLQPGDLVFFNTQRKPFSHVGIYLGEGRFIHAPREGAVVRTENLRARYWTTRFDGARRIGVAVVTAGYPAPPKKPVITYP